MATTYKEKLIGEINAIPESLLPRFYRIMHTLRTELTRRPTTSRTRGSLKGIWKGSNIDDSLLAESKKSLFLYEYNDRH
jgi:hypothetical protein